MMSALYAFQRLEVAASNLAKGDGKLHERLGAAFSDGLSMLPLKEEHDPEISEIVGELLRIDAIFTRKGGSPVAAAAALHPDEQMALADKIIDLFGKSARAYEINIRAREAELKIKEAARQKAAKN